MLSIIEFIKPVAKYNKMWGFFPTRLINSIEPEHSCKILYIRHYSKCSKILNTFIYFCSQIAVGNQG